MAALGTIIPLLFAASALSAAPLWQIAPSSENSAARLLELSPAADSAVLLQPNYRALHDESISLPLSDGRLLQIRRSRSETRAFDDGQAKSLSWFGEIEGEPDSTVVLTSLTQDGEHYLAGYVQGSAGLFEIVPSPSGPVLMALDVRRFPDCGGVIEPPLTQHKTAALTNRTLSTNTSAGVLVSAVTAPQDLPNEIDVLIVIRPGSVTQLGGQPAALTFAQNAVNVSNQSFTNSQMIARFRLAGTFFTTEVDTGTASGELNWVRSNAEVAARRETTRADMVSVISEFSDACGVGALMNQLGTGFANSAFQATARSCAVGNLSYPHEHGHNMGLMHDPGNGGNSLFAYGFGHFVSGSYRTVMSYANNCVGGCTRVPYFSNPNVTYLGAATGIANQRDNARAGNTTAPDVANFRQAVSVLFANGFE